MESPASRKARRYRTACLSYWLAPLTTKIHITEGEKYADVLARMNFVADYQQRGREQLDQTISTNTLTIRDVYIHEDNDEQGRNRVQPIARALHPIAASVRIIRLPGLKQARRCLVTGLQSDPQWRMAGQECEARHPRGTLATPLPEEEKKEGLPVRLN